jgi:hypothetical protein
MSDEKKFADSLGVPVHEPRCPYCDSDAHMHEMEPKDYPQYTNIECAWVNGSDYAALRARVAELEADAEAGRKRAENSDQGKLAEIAALEANWDSYGAPPIDPVCIEMARIIVGQCPGFFDIVPCCDGTITLERHSDGAEVYCHIFPTEPTRE